MIQSMTRDENDLQVTREYLSSLVMKRIDNFQFYHSKSEHVKLLFLNLNKQEPQLFVSQS